MKFWVFVITVAIGAAILWYFMAPSAEQSARMVLSPTDVPPTAAASVDNTTGVAKGRIIRLTTADIKARMQDFGSAESQIADIILQPDRATLDLLVGGVKGTFTTGLAVANNQIVLVTPAIDGLLGAVLPAEKIGQLLQDELNKRLVDQPVLDVRIVQDAIEIVVNP